MKIKATGDLDKLAGCFRGGMAAYETTCHLREVADSFHTWGSKKLLKAIGNPKVVQSLRKAAKEAERIPEQIPGTKRAVGTLTKMINHFADDVSQRRKSLTYDEDKRLRERFSNIGQSVIRMYKSALENCGPSVPENEVLWTIYPERKRKSI